MAFSGCSSTGQQPPPPSEAFPVSVRLAMAGDGTSPGFPLIRWMSPASPPPGAHLEVAVRKGPAASYGEATDLWRTSMPLSSGIMGQVTFGAGAQGSQPPPLVAGQVYTAAVSVVGGSDAEARAVTTFTMVTPPSCPALVPNPTAVDSKHQVSSAPVFNRLPVDLSSYDQSAQFVVVPLGNMNPKSGHALPTTHGYWNVMSNHAPLAESVVAPADLYVQSVLWTPGGYYVAFAVCSELTGYFGQLSTLSDTLKHLLATSAGAAFQWDCANDQMCVYGAPSPVLVPSGTVLGSSGAPVENPKDGSTRSIGIQGVAWELHDTRVELAYADVARHTPSQQVLSGWLNAQHLTPEVLSVWADLGNAPSHVVAPIDYYTKGVDGAGQPDYSADGQTALAGLQAASGGHREAPIGWQVDWDVPGTARGDWYRQGASEVDVFMNEGKTALGLVESNTHEDREVFSTGIELGIQPGHQAGLWSFTPSASTCATSKVNCDFASVTPGGDYCFEQLQAEDGSVSTGVVLVHMPDASHLLIRTDSRSSCLAAPGHGNHDDGAPGAGELVFVR